MRARRTLVRILFWLALAPAAIIAGAFAIANRVAVEISLDPLPYAIALPLYAVAFLGLGVGLAVGLVATWPSLVRWRAAARGRARAIATLEGEVARLNRERTQRADPGKAIVPAPGGAAR